MKKYIIPLMLIGLLTLLWGCVNEPEYPLEPVISNPIVSKTAVNQGDSVLISFEFTDGDGNIGTQSIDTFSCDGNSICSYDANSCYRDPFFSAYFIDSRDSCYGYLQLPDLEPSGSIKAVSGEIDIVVPAIFCKCSGCPSDEVSYQIIIKDASGNYSNIIETATISVNCQ